MKAIRLIKIYFKILSLQKKKYLIPLSIPDLRRTPNCSCKHPHSSAVSTSRHQSLYTTTVIL